MALILAHSGTMQNSRRSGVPTLQPSTVYLLHNPAQQQPTRSRHTSEYASTRSREHANIYEIQRPSRISRSVQSAVFGVITAINDTNNNPTRWHHRSDGRPLLQLRQLAAAAPAAAHYAEFHVRSALQPSVARTHARPLSPRASYIPTAIVPTYQQPSCLRAS